MYLDDAITAIMQFDTPRSWIYLDYDGGVRIGAHQLLESADMAVLLPFQRWTNAPATQNEIRNEFARVQAMRKGFRPDSYRRSESLLLPRVAAKALLRGALIRCAQGLMQQFSDFDIYPDLVKIALLDLYYCDTEKFHTHTAFCDAIQKQNWSLVSTLCHSEHARDDHNKWIRKQFQDIPVLV